MVNARARCFYYMVALALKGMELSERFNAGRGSALQADAQARLTAAMMDSQNNKFSGVISTSYISHPSLVARHLQDQSAQVLTNPGAELLARRLGLPLAENITPERFERFAKRFRESEHQLDTVGCVVRDAGGVLAAGTSTGGRGFEFPGRVSDSATVAGTYCSHHAAISATGVGEQIVDDALCARMETRCRDGMSLKESSSRCYAEAMKNERAYGWIGIGEDDGWCATYTTSGMSFVVIGGDGEVIASS